VAGPFPPEEGREGQTVKPVGKTLSETQKRAATLVAAGLSDISVAEQLGLHRSTVWQWRKWEPFQKEVALQSDVMRDAIVFAQKRAMEKVAELAPEAVQRLKDALDAMHTVSAGGGTYEADWANRLRAVEDVLKANELGGFGKPSPAAGGGQAAAIVQVVISPEVKARAEELVGGEIVVESKAAT
jgi:hypothetical protein